MSILVGVDARCGRAQGLRTHILSATAIWVAAVAGAQPTMAQDAGGDDSGGLQEIVVTAQKRLQDQQDVPIAVSVLSGDTLRELGVNSSEDLQTHIAGLEQYNYLGKGHAQFIVRGIGTADFAQNTPPAAPVYLDDVYLGANVVSGFQLFDIERVEVLKGPQGTLFGRNTTGGAISYHSRAPTDTLEGYATLTGGSQQTVEAEGAISGPLSPRARARLSGRVRSQNDGYFTNDFGGSVTPVSPRYFNPERSVGEGTDYSVRAQLELEPVDDLTFLLNGHYARSKGDTYPTTAVAILDRPGAAAPCPALGGDPSGTTSDPALCQDVLGYSEGDAKRRTHNDFIGEQFIRGYGVNLNAAWDLGAATLTSISAYDKGEQDVGTDVDGSPNFQAAKIRYYDVEAFSQEVRLASGASDPFFWMIGGYYSTDKISLFDDSDFTPDANLLVGGLLPLTNLADPAFNMTAVGGAFVDNQQDTESWAVFGHTEWRFAPAWKLTAGLRYTDVSADFFSQTVWTYDRAFAQGLVPSRTVLADVDGTGPGLIDDSDSWKSVSGKLAVDWTPVDDVLLYLSYSRGFRAGGFEGNFVLSAGQTAPYDKETLNAYELGWKTELLHRKLRLNGAVYYYDYQDAQQRATSISPATGAPANFIQSIGDARQYGVDVEALVAATDNLTVGASASYIDQEIKSPGFAIYDGNRFPFAPRWSATATARYNRELAGGLELTLQTDAKYTGSYFTTAENHRFLEQDGYINWNARAAIGSADDAWEVAAFIKNITTSAHITQSYALFGAYIVGYNPPRTWGVTLTKRW